jgi:hypothetical protein
VSPSLPKQTPNQLTDELNDIFPYQVPFGFKPNKKLFETNQNGKNLWIEGRRHPKYTQPKLSLHSATHRDWA